MFKKNCVPWNKGTKGIMISWNKGRTGVYSKETLKKMSLAKQGRASNATGCRWNHTKKWKRWLSIKMKGNNIARGHIPHNKGKEHLSGPRHWNWQGGKSKEPYAVTWTSQLRDKIRVRDNFHCQICRVPEMECKKGLQIHHIDYDKKN
jgi:hypothetical protein